MTTSMLGCRILLGEVTPIDIVDIGLMWCSVLSLLGLGDGMDISQWGWYRGHVGWHGSRLTLVQCGAVWSLRNAGWQWPNGWALGSDMASLSLLGLGDGMDASRWGWHLVTRWVVVAHFELSVDVAYAELGKRRVSVEWVDLILLHTLWVSLSRVSPWFPSPLRPHLPSVFKRQPTSLNRGSNKLCGNCCLVSRCPN